MAVHLCAISEVGNGTLAANSLTLEHSRPGLILDVPLSFVFLYSETNPSQILMREGKELLFGLPGGKEKKNEGAKECAIREVDQETGLIVKAKNLELVAETNMPGFYGSWPKKTAREHGYRFADRHDGTTPGPVQLIHTAQTFFCVVISEKEIVPCFKGHALKMIDISEPGSLDLIKPKFRPAIRLWKKVVALNED